MENQQQEMMQAASEPDLRTIPELSTAEISERMAECKRVIKETDRYFHELEAEWVNRIPHKEKVIVDMEVEVDGALVTVPVTIQHKFTSGYRKYSESQVIRELKRHSQNPSLYIREVEMLNRGEFEMDVFEVEELEPLRRFLKPYERHIAEVRGVP